MKKILSFVFILMSILSMSSCNGDEVIQSLDTDNATSSDSLYVISFGMADFDVENETRAATDKTIYGINIEYYKNGSRQGYYAYGLFDDISKASITLIGGFTYSFTCSIVRPAGDELWYGPYYSNSYSGYAQPFQLNNSSSTQCLNRFVEGTGNYLSGLGSGTSIVKSSTSSSGYVSSNYPSLERYYGKLETFNPATDGTNVIIPVVKTYFGCKLILKAVVDGTLNTGYYSNTSLDFLRATTTTTDYVGAAQIYTFPDVAACWTNRTYSQKQTIYYEYKSNRQSLNGSPDWWNLYGNKEITFKRNVLTTITVGVTEDLSGASLGITDEAMGEDNVIEFVVDENYNLNQKDN